MLQHEQGKPQTRLRNNFKKILWRPVISGEIFTCFDLSIMKKIEIQCCDFSIITGAIKEKSEFLQRVNYSTLSKS